jgi:thiosulfate reductase cytochrome b subunit
VYFRKFLQYQECRKESQCRTAVSVTKESYRTWGGIRKQEFNEKFQLYTFIVVHLILVVVVHPEIEMRRIIFFEM